MTKGNIDADTLRGMLERGEPVTVVDVRKAEDRAEWFIPGSVHFAAYDALNAGNERAMEGLEVPEGAPVVTVCGRGRSSALAAEQRGWKTSHIYADPLSRTRSLAAPAGAELHMPEGTPLSEVRGNTPLLGEDEGVFVEKLAGCASPTPQNYERVVGLNRAGEWPEAGANRCAAG